jgi:putative Ca2+/H+ antiporter (TMEM165/GDT1 family)
VQPRSHSPRLPCGGRCRDRRAAARIAPCLPPYSLRGGGSPLDWHAALVAFGLIFLSELGDKTQLATMMLAAENHSALSVFVGATAALVMVAGASALVGDGLYHLVPPRTLRRIAGGLFTVLGAVLLLRAR